MLTVNSCSYINALSGGCWLWSFIWIRPPHSFPLLGAINTSRARNSLAPAAFSDCLPQAALTVPKYKLNRKYKLICSPLPLPYLTNQSALAQFLIFAGLSRIQKPICQIMSINPFIRFDPPIVITCGLFNRIQTVSPHPSSLSCTILFG